MLGTVIGSRTLNNLTRIFVLVFTKAHQRRVIRVSKTFGESRSSDNARPDRRERSVWPALLPQAATLQKPTGLFADRLRP